ncbi:hypothetical protein GCM10009416_01180 [Craurococcus roseus]|uniref:Polysaccharide pyruvyl transferase domain-containing protein n=1 Tax=Craurococcus roseus TaxID=77585 RepID=A0ABP3PLD8_9PROT
MDLKVTYMTLPGRSSGRRQNVGDRIIHLGVRNIMLCALGPHEAREVNLASKDPVPDDTDVLVVCGTPQIAKMQPVVAPVRRAAEAADAPVPVRLNLGAGAVYVDDFGADRAGRDAAFAQSVREAPVAATYARYAGFHLCTTRDLAATAALRGVGVPALPLPCPGFFSALFQPRPLLRHARPLVSVLNGGVGMWNSVAGDVHGFYERLREARPDALFVAHDEEDCEMLADLGIPHVAFEDADELVAALAAHERLLSVRVHSALPAWALGLDVTLLGLDRRALIGEDFGASFRVLPLRKEDDLRKGLAAVGGGARPAQDDATRAAWLARHLDLYVGAVRSAVEAVLGPLPPRADPARPPAPEPAMLAEAGLYRARLFHSTEREFGVGADRLRSHYRAEHHGDEMAFVTDGEQRTLVYGPYVTIPRGRWSVELEISADPPPGTQEPPPGLMLSVTKGMPPAVLAQNGIEPAPAGASWPWAFPITFRNPRDTGMLETVVRSPGGPLAPGWRFRVGGLRFRRLD